MTLLAQAQSSVHTFTRYTDIDCTETLGIQTVEQLCEIKQNVSKYDSISTDIHA